MSVPSEDMASRERDIFARLRAMSADGGPAAEPEQTEAAGGSDDHDTSALGRPDDAVASGELGGLAPAGRAPGSDPEAAVAVPAAGDSVSGGTGVVAAASPVDETDGTGDGPRPGAAVVSETHGGPGPPETASSQGQPSTLVEGPSSPPEEATDQVEPTAAAVIVLPPQDTAREPADPSPPASGGDEPAVASDGLPAAAAPGTRTDAPAQVAPALTAPSARSVTAGEPPVQPALRVIPSEEHVEAAAPASSRPVRELPRVIAIANQKGGVGKTTTAVNLGAGLAERGYRVLVVDLDPQGNASTGLNVDSRNLEHSIYDVILRDVPLEDCIEPTSLRHLFVAPATIDLAGAEIELVPAFSRELRLRRAVEQVLDDFDFLLIDCPPSLGLLTVNGLAAASEVMVPIQCEYYALEGLSQLLRNVQLVQANLNPQLEVSAIVMTMYDARTKLAEQVVREVRRRFGTVVCRNVVPRTVRLSEAPSFGEPILLFDPTSRGAIAYRALAEEVSGGAPQRAR